MTNPVPLPIHFKLPGRSYSQIGRKGNVALYSVYSDYMQDRMYGWPYVLLGFELIVIKVRNGCEVYPSAWQFGKCAWSIPKSFARVCYACSRSSRSCFAKLRKHLPNPFPDRSTLAEERAHLAHISSPSDQTPSENATIAPQRRVTLR